MKISLVRTSLQRKKEKKQQSFHGLFLSILMWLELWRNLLCLLLDLLGTLITSSILMKHLCKLFLNLFLVSFEAFFFTFIYLRFSSGILCDSIGVFSFLYRFKLKLTQGSWGQNSLQMNIGKKRLQGICWNRKMIQMLQIWCDLKPPVDMLWPYFSYYSLLKTRFIILSLNCRSRDPLQTPRNDNVIHTLMFLCFSGPLLNFKMMGWLVRSLYGRMNGWLLGSRLRL